MQIKLIAALSGTALAAAALTALVLWPAPADVDTAAVAVAQAQTASDAQGAMKQGIAVRGHWQIEVRNPDGSLAQRREFDNALLSSGKDVIKRILLRESKVALFSVRLEGNPNACAAPGTTTPYSCYLVQPFFDNPSPPIPETTLESTNLLVTEIADGVRLTGTKIAALNGNISKVSTRIHECFWDRTISNCTASDGSPVAISQDFTTHTLASADVVPVVAGQQILVNVDLSFVPAP